MIERGKYQERVDTKTIKPTKQKQTKKNMIRKKDQAKKTKTREKR